MVHSAPRRSTDAGRGSDELAFLCGFLLLGSGLASLSESIGIRWRNNETLLLESDPEIPTPAVDPVTPAGRGSVLGVDSIPGGDGTYLISLVGDPRKPFRRRPQW